MSTPVLPMRQSGLVAFSRDWAKGREDAEQRFGSDLDTGRLAATSPSGEAWSPEPLTLGGWSEGEPSYHSP